jgi:hypothetical protein
MRLKLGGLHSSTKQQMLAAAQTSLALAPAAVLGGGGGVGVVAEAYYAAEYCLPGAEEGGEGVGWEEAAASQLPRQQTRWLALSAASPNGGDLAVSLPQSAKLRSLKAAVQPVLNKLAEVQRGRPDTLNCVL